MEAKIKRQSEGSSNPRASETKKYRAKHQDRIKQYLARWRLDNKEKQREYFRLYYIVHRDELIERALDYKHRMKKLKEGL